MNLAGLLPGAVNDYALRDVAEIIVVLVRGTRIDQHYTTGINVLKKPGRRI
jgi:hypothetical protein